MTLKSCKIKTMTMVALMSATLYGCEQPEMEAPRAYYSIDPDEYFDFATVATYDISIDLDRQALINIYDVDPRTHADAVPIYATFTDDDGRYTGKIQLPKAALGETLWAEGYGFYTKAMVRKNGVHLSAKYNTDYPESRSDENLPEDDYITHMLSEDEIYNECKRLHNLYMTRMPEERNNTSKLTETENLAIYTIKDNTEIMFSFVHSGGRYLSQLFYFYFPQEVDATEYMRQYVTSHTPLGETPDLSSDNLRAEFMRLFTNKYGNKFMLTRDWGVIYTGRNQYSETKTTSSSDGYYVTDAEGNRMLGNGFTNAKASYTDDELEAMKALGTIQPVGTTLNWHSNQGDWKYFGPGWVNRNFNNKVGEHHHLRFYGDDYEQSASYFFPAGYRIGFILKVLDTDKYSPTEPANQYFNLFTTNNALNKTDPETGKGNVQVARNLSISPSSDQRGLTTIVYGYEDKVLQDGSDRDYNDFLFMVAASPAVSTDGMTVITEEGKMMIDGTLLYEDLYPAPGDYDMNDVMVEYEMWVTFDKNNYVTKLNGKFWPTCYGATYNDDLYIGLATGSGANRKQRIAPTRILTADQIRSLASYNFYDINHDKRPSRYVEYTWEFDPSEKINKDDVTIENLNPFIYVHNTQREVHLTKLPFCGVEDATTEGLSDGEKQYYPLMISDGSKLNGLYFPYAMNVPIRYGVSLEGFHPVTEKVNITDEYPDFREWMAAPADARFQAWYKYYLNKIRQ